LAAAVGRNDEGLLASVGGKSDAFSVGRPDRKLVFARSEGDAPQSAAFEVVNPNVRIRKTNGERKLFTVRGEARRLIEIGLDRKGLRFDIMLSPDQIILGALPASGNENKNAVGGNIVLGSA